MKGVVGGKNAGWGGKHTTSNNKWCPHWSISFISIQHSRETSLLTGLIIRPVNYKAMSWTVVKEWENIPQQTAFYPCL